MSGDGFEHNSCAVCGRTVLAGERVAEYVTPEGSAADVCMLCKPRAEASGWVPAAVAASRPGGGRARRRRGFGLRVPRLRSGGGGRSGAQREPKPRSERAPARPAPEARGPGATSPSPAPRREAAPRREPAPQPPGQPPQPRSPDRIARDAIEAFNESREARKVAGLARSLGLPSASVVAIGAAATITVAWELSWYQWRVADGRIEEVGKGSEIAQLADANRAWNATAAEDGSLRLGVNSGAGGPAPKERAGVAAVERGGGAAQGE